MSTLFILTDSPSSGVAVSPGTPATGGNPRGYYALPITAAGDFATQMRPRPKPWTLDLRDWCRDRREQLLALCPLERATTVYLHPYATDMGAAGTGADPRPQTIPSMRKILQEHPEGNVRIRLLKATFPYVISQGAISPEESRVPVVHGNGGTIADVGGLLIDRDNVTIDSYGEGLRPEFSRFYHYVGSYWEQTPGTTRCYRLKTGCNVSAVACFRRKNECGGGTVLRYVETVAQCEATPGSFTNDGPSPSIHPLDDAQVSSDYLANYDYCLPLPANLYDTPTNQPYDTSGSNTIRVTGRNCRLHGLNIVGGADDPRTARGSGAPGYCVHAGGLGVVAITDCDLVWARRHHVVAGGYLVMDNVRTMGLTNDGGSVVDYGAEEVHLANVGVGPQQVPYGLKPYGTNSNTTTTGGLVFCHPSGETGVVTKLASFDGIRKVRPDDQWQAGSLVDLTTAMPPAQDRLADPDGDSMRCFLFDVRDTFRRVSPLDRSLSQNSLGLVGSVPMGNAVHVGCEYEGRVWFMDPAEGNDQNLGGLRDGRTMLVRSRLRYDSMDAESSGEPPINVFYRGAIASGLRIELYSCSVLMRCHGGYLAWNGGTQQTSLNDAQKADAQAHGLNVSSNDAALVAAYWTQVFPGIAWDSVFLCDAWARLAGIGWGNSADRLRNNAYGGFNVTNGLQGCDQDPFANRENTSRGEFSPPPDSPLWSSHAQRPLDYDGHLRRLQPRADGKQSQGAF